MKLTKLLYVTIVLLLASCSGSGNDDPTVIPTPTPIIPTTILKEAASFPIGNIVSASRLSGSDSDFRALLNKEFNSITAENDMKMASMFTGPDTYDFSKGDAIVAYAKANGFRVHGHTLVWHGSIPNWLQNYTGSDAEFEAQV
ncbi:endo-1,4-beta-xylanase, partial [Yeosuana marina]|uniref:endo-1,4-beta-xylanase n=1 Tax=Yeosuana marina TaxID=1565536 RepID=UPI0030C8C163